MKLSRRVEFHGRQLDAVTPEVIIQSADRGAPKENVTAADRMAGYGQRITGSHWQMLEASVTFSIDIPRSKMDKRVTAFEKVRDWACGTTYGKGIPSNPWLRIYFNGRKETEGTGLGGATAVADRFASQQLRVDKVIFPSSADLFDWTAEYTIKFVAYNVPFWQDIKGTTIQSGTNASGNVTLTVPGNMRTPVNIKFENKSGKDIKSLVINTDITKITLNENFTLAANKTLTISHTDDGLMKITNGTTSNYAKFTGSDDLLIEPGSEKIYYKADRAGILTAEVFGRYL